VTTPPTNLRARASLVPHRRVLLDEGLAVGILPDNIVVRARTPAEAWAEEATAKIGEWRSLTRSVYIRWAITINASVVAEERYRTMDPDKALTISALRLVEGQPQQVRLALWPAPEAARRYEQTTPLIAAYGVVDLFGALEDVIFDLYEILLRHNPTPLIRGPEFSEIRRLWRERDQSPDASDAWKAAWAERYGSWRRKRAYAGLHAVFQALFEHARLKRPSQFRYTDVEDWCRTMEMIAELRHLIVHGAAVVSEKLAKLSNTPTSLTFEFVEGAQLEVQLHHLQSVECFCDQLLNAINVSIVERIYGVIGKHAQPET
jgi:hypothetical protein